GNGLRIFRPRPVGRGDHHHAPRIGEKARGIEPLVAPCAHVREPRVPALREPAVEPLRREWMCARDAAEIEAQPGCARLDLLRRDSQRYVFQVMASPSRMGMIVETRPSLPKMSRVYSRSPAVAASLSPRATAPPQSTLSASTRPPGRSLDKAMASAFGYSAFSPSRKTMSRPASQR